MSKMQLKPLLLSKSNIKLHVSFSFINASYSKELYEHSPGVCTTAWKFFSCSWRIFSALDFASFSKALILCTYWLLRNFRSAFSCSSLRRLPFSSKTRCGFFLSYWCGDYYLYISFHLISIRVHS